MKSQKRIEDEGREAGFDDRKIQFLLENFTPPGHHHSTGQIDGLKQEVEDIIAKEAGDDDYDDDEDEEEDDEEEEPEHSRYLDE
jgi:hypothetical protein